jgi:hypothetical protein
MEEKRGALQKEAIFSGLFEVNSKGTILHRPDFLIMKIAIL